MSWSKDLSCSDTDPTTLPRPFNAVVTIFFASCSLALGDTDVILLWDCGNPGSTF